jgi:hypothetical protein
MGWPLAAAVVVSAGINAFGSSQSGKRAEKAARQSAALDRQNSLFDARYADARNVQGAGVVLGMIMNAARMGRDIPKEWLVEAEKLLGPSFEAFNDVVSAYAGKYKEGIATEVKNLLAKHKGLPGGMEVALTRQGQDKATDAMIGAQAQGKLEHTKMGQEVNLANAKNSLLAAQSNLQARAQLRGASMNAMAAGLGPLQRMLQTNIPGHTQPFQGPIAASPWETAGNAATTAMTLYNTMGGGPLKLPWGSGPETARF